MSTAELQALDAETWGERIGRARSRAGLSLKEAASRVSDFIPVSYASIMRLENLGSEPPDAKRRAVAFLTLVAYGYNPAEFGLSRSDVPRWITDEHLAALPLLPTPPVRQQTPPAGRRRTARSASDLPISPKRWLATTAAQDAA